MERTEYRVDGRRFRPRVMDCPQCLTKHGKIPEELCDWDWSEAFEYALFDREDVAEIVVMEDGENDGENWVGVFKLIDGRYGGLSAGCDYTGWD